MDLQAVSDKIEIMELLTRYASSVDTRDWERLKSVFTPEAELDYSSVQGPVAPRDEVIAWLESGLGAVPWTQHLISNLEIELDGDRAKVRAMFYNPMLLPGMTDYSFCGGYYNHELVRTAEGWKSEHLVEDNVWFVNRPGARSR